MAVPNIDWEEWSKPEIAPTMAAIIHFPLGDIAYTDNEIYGVEFKAVAFDTQYQLFGPPKPTTGSITFLDYEQRLNPTYNGELNPGIEIELFLGLKEGYGANQVDEVFDTTPVMYKDKPVFAVPFTTKAPLHQKEFYRIYFTYILPDGSLEVVDTEGIFEELFIVPSNWPNSNKLALVHDSDVTVAGLIIQPVLNNLNPYGVFYADNWEYDASEHTATVNFVCKMNELLLLDNRRDAALPSTGVNAQQFLQELIGLYVPSESNSQSTYELLFSFYEDAQSTTINELVVALGKALFFMPDGSLALSDYTGFYDTEVILTDEDVEEYEIQQTSAVSMDSAIVEANLPSSVEATELATFSNIELSSGDIIPLSVSRVMSVDYLTASGVKQIYPEYTYTIADVTYDPMGNAPAEPFDTFKVFGAAIQVSPLPVYSVLGSLPYEIKENPYIQTSEQAATLVWYLDSFIDKSLRIVKVTLRGCYGFWPGAKLRIGSEAYSLNAEYVIIEMSFSYDGAVSTTLTLQRIG